MTSLQDFRDFYARLVVRRSDASSRPVVAAFAAIKREHFAGPGPWRIHTGYGYVETPSDDPRFLYQDIVIALAQERGIHNGMPSLHASCLCACEPKVGESVVHIGAGTGYYTAILAELVGPTGTVTAFEIEADLARRAEANLRLPNVRVLAVSAVESPIPGADVIYVCAGATHPVADWLDALNIGGRLLFPLTPNEGLGCMLLITRTRDATYAASSLQSVAFIPCIGARDDLTSDALVAAFEAKSPELIRSLHRGTHPDATAWCVGTDWWLSTSAPT